VPSINIIATAHIRADQQIYGLALIKISRLNLSEGQAGDKPQSASL
jgi:hypothetical protein